MFGEDRFAIKKKSQARIEIGVVPEPFVDELFSEGKLFKNLRIGSKLDVGAIGLFCLSLLFIL